LPGWLAASRLFFLDHTAGKAGALAAELARAQGLPVVADLERPELPYVERLLAQVDHLVVNLDFACRYTLSSSLDEIFIALAWRNPHPGQREPRRACVITAGDQGCWYCERAGEVFHMPAFPVQVVDTTGCGDVFHGAYAAAIARGESVSRAVLLASASAALKAASPGGRLGIPRLPEVLAFLEDHPQLPSPAR
jgi:sugar/nucleoside kinase (ribokinase family)